VGLPVGGLGPVQVAVQPPDLPDLVVPLGGPGDLEVGQVGADQGRLPLGLGPGTPALQDLGAVDPADAGEQHGRGQGGQPAAGRVRPLGGPADVGQLGEGGHQVAVDVAGPLRAELARADGQHGLVQPGQPLGDPAHLDQGPALEQVAGGGQVGVGVAAAEPPEPPGPLGHGPGVVAAERPFQLEVEQVAVRGDLGLVLEEPLGPSEPAGADDRVPAQEGVTATPRAAMAAAPGRPSSRWRRQAASRTADASSTSPSHQAASPRASRSAAASSPAARAARNRSRAPAQSRRRWASLAAASIPATSSMRPPPSQMTRTSLPSLLPAAKRS
jgi:hypothetical protein